MDDNMDLEHDPKRTRAERISRLRAPRATRETRHKKKTPTGFGGSHRRRNKHWSW